ncbi:MAG: cysteine methyltransferase [Proteobacteria bacterium]|nr:MAG: cysteine methyltransferase [Pseudomonadota bacterium]
MQYQIIDTPLGKTILAANAQGLNGLWFEGQRHFKGVQADWEYTETPLLQQAAQQFNAYLLGQRQSFDLPLAPQGTAFQQSVWQALLAVDYGRTCAYSELAERMNQPKAVRAIAAAIGRNPISVIIPCHRILGSRQQLTGYAGGLERKQWLLWLEQGIQPQSLF